MTLIIHHVNSLNTYLHVHLRVNAVSLADIQNGLYDPGCLGVLGLCQMMDVGLDQFNDETFRHAHLDLRWADDFFRHHYCGHVDPGR